MAPQQPESSARGANEPATATGRSEWFYVQRGEIYGPVTSTDLSAAAHLGFLGPDDMVRRSDMTAWVAARTVHGLFKNRD
jgi:hypothetical protein